MKKENHDDNPHSQYPQTSVTIALEHHQKLCLQVYRQVFRNAKLAKREGVSVGHLVDTSVKVLF